MSIVIAGMLLVVLTLALVYFLLTVYPALLSVINRQHRRHPEPLESVDATGFDLDDRGHRPGTASAVSSAPSARPEPVWNRPMVIIVSDIQERIIALEALRARGHDVLEASSGVQGLRMAAQLNPSIAVVDEALQPNRWQDICHALRRSASHSDIRILLLTSEIETVVTSFVEGLADATIEKPYRTETLQACVDDLLTSRPSYRYQNPAS